MKNQRITAVLGLSLILSGCNWWSSSSNEKESKYDGVWLAPEYGQGMEIKSGKLTSFDYTSDFCLKDDVVSVTEGEIDESVILDSSELSFELIVSNGTKQFHSPGEIYTKVDGLPDSCINGFEEVVGQSGYDRSPEKDVAIFFQTFAEYYVDLSLSTQDWSEVEQTISGNVDDSTSDAELFELLYNAITVLKDSHVFISSDNIGLASVNNSPVFYELMLNRFIVENEISLPIPADLIESWSDYLEQAYQLHYDAIHSYAESEQSITSRNEGAFTWFKNQGVGYLEISRMYNYNNGEDKVEEDLDTLSSRMSEIIEDLKDTDALILDLRFNNGGRDVNSMLVASYFIENSDVLLTKTITDPSGNESYREFYVEAQQNRYTKPVFILTSASTVSAAETLVLMLKSQSHVILVGEQTQGAFSNQLNKTLPNGFSFSLSTEKYLSHDSQWYERQGVPVDVPVELFKVDDWANNSDAAIEAVLDLL